MSVRRQLSLDLEDDELFVVGFAGGGGSCTGYELATRCMCGNSVCPPVAAALIRANLPEMSARSRAATAAERMAA